MPIAEPIGVLAAILTTFGFIPQLIKLLKTRETAGISVIMIAQVATGLFLWFLYGILKKDPILIGANGISLSITLITLSLVLRYRNAKSWKD
jgi:MtN3 and saliva related transmembrane protein